MAAPLMGSGNGSSSESSGGSGGFSGGESGGAEMEVVVGASLDTAMGAAVVVVEQRRCG